ncbi:Kinesin-like protein kif27 [Geranomyces variabilis]|uniref:Kinesin-like protein kif27 n=1 Tax=Geranomyces variabilis TaxID=109894 RepID=A0AAD5TGZ7_9FUNG|nr:Kinesin-like protein kif27 [Geranomyces variabilis]
MNPSASVASAFRRLKGGGGSVATDAEAKNKKPSLLPPRNGDTLWEQLTKFYVIPEGSFLRTWDEVMVILAIINAILVPFMAAFQYHSVGAWIVSYIIDVLFFVDMYIKFHVAYLVGGFWVVFPKEMMMHYLQSWDFVFDVLINFPVDIVAFGWLGKGNNLAQTKLSLIRLWKILRTGRIIIYYRRQEKKLHASFRVQVLKFVSYAIVLTHGISCIWFANACSGNIVWPSSDISASCNSDSWVNSSMEFFGLASLGLGQLYIASTYWAIVTMTTLGYGDIRPNNTSERIFSIFTALCGILFYGYINGTIASTLSNMDSRRVAYQQRLDAVKQYMTDRKMDPDMKERVLTYYDYVWERNRGIDVRGLFVDMPSAFKQEVALSLNNQIIDNAVIFKECSIGFRRMIAIDMKLFLFTANEYVVHKGDLGLEMYFITQGRIDIYATDDLRRPTASLIEGAYFGEFCVVLGNRHEYSARAVCNTDIYVFAKEDLEAAFAAYPADRTVVDAATQKRYQQHLSARKSRVPATGGRKQHHSEFDDMEEEFGAKGSVLKGDIPVRLAGEPQASMREIENLDPSAMRHGGEDRIGNSGPSGRGAGASGAGGEAADLEDLENAGGDYEKASKPRTKMSSTGSGYMILDKTMATALSQNSLARGKAAQRSQSNLGNLAAQSRKSSHIRSAEMSPARSETPDPAAAADLTARPSTGIGASSSSNSGSGSGSSPSWGNIAASAAAARGTMRQPAGSSTTTPPPQQQLPPRSAVLDDAPVPAADIQLGKSNSSVNDGSGRSGGSS